MRRVALAFVSTLSLSIAALPAYAKESAPKIADDPDQLLQDFTKNLPPPKVLRHGFLNRPGQVQSFSFFTASGRNSYAVCPAKSLDVVMGIFVQGYRGVRIDRRGRGGCETFSFSVPRQLPVTVKIGDFSGSGRWGFAAEP